MATSTQLCNQALIKLGGKMIADVDNPVTATGQICAELLQPSIDTFTTSFRWSWAETMELLDPVADPSPAPIDYDYEYNFPTDCLLVLKIQNEDGVKVSDYSLLSGGRIRCNYDVIKLYYVVRPAPTDLPESVIDGFTTYFAHRLSPAIDGGKRGGVLWQEYLQKATSAFMEDASQRKEPIDSEDYFSGS